MTNMSIQTRSEFTGCEHWYSVREAYDAYQKDTSIWKISWSEGSFDHRFRPIHKQDLLKWQRLSLQKIKQLCPNFDTILKSEILWVDQQILAKCLDTELNQIDRQTLDKMRNGICLEEATKWQQDERQKLKERFPTEEVYEEWKDAECITEVLTDNQFKEKYCKSD